jgi:hypothetical protein
MNTNEQSKDEVRDQLPHDLDVSAFVGPYQFPDNSRRRIPAFIYASFSAVCLIVWLVARDSNSGTVNNGFVIASFPWLLLHSLFGHHHGK